MQILTIHVVYEMPSVRSWLVLLFQAPSQGSLRYLVRFAMVWCGGQNSKNDPANDPCPLCNPLSLGQTCEYVEIAFP